MADESSTEFELVLGRMSEQVFPLDQIDAGLGLDYETDHIFFSLLHTIRMYVL